MAILEGVISEAVWALGWIDDGTPPILAGRFSANPGVVFERCAGLRYEPPFWPGTAAALVLGRRKPVPMRASTKSVPAHKPIKVSTPVLEPAA